MKKVTLLLVLIGLIYSAEVMNLCYSPCDAQGYRTITFMLQENKTVIGNAEVSVGNELYETNNLGIFVARLKGGEDVPINYQGEQLSLYSVPKCGEVLPSEEEVVPESGKKGVSTTSPFWLLPLILLLILGILAYKTFIEKPEAK